MSLITPLSTMFDGCCQTAAGALSNRQNMNNDQRAAGKHILANEMKLTTLNFCSLSLITTIACTFLRIYSLQFGLFMGLACALGKEVAEKSLSLSKPKMSRRVDFKLSAAWAGLRGNKLAKDVFQSSLNPKSLYKVGDVTVFYDQPVLFTAVGIAWAQL